MAKVHEYRRLVARVSDLRAFVAATGNETTRRQLGDLVALAVALRDEIRRSGIQYEAGLLV